jgi:hypothetical protein
MASERETTTKTKITISPIHADFGFITIIGDENLLYSDDGIGELWFDDKICSDDTQERSKNDECHTSKAT